MPSPIGVVSHYYPLVHAAIVRIQAGPLRVGDTVHFRGHTTDFSQRIERIEIEHRSVEVAYTGQEVGIQVSQQVREGDQVTRVSR